jgi:membrane-associated HD superfamily phosphohydrolase
MLSVIHQVPILAGMIILALGSIVLYKFDVVLQVLGHIGEKTAFYLLIVLCVCVVGALIYLLFCLYWKFKLHKYEIQQQWEYKQKVIEKSGLIILDNNTVVNGEGKLITHDVIIQNAGDDVVKEKALVPLAEKLLLK